MKTYMAGIPLKICGVTVIPRWNWSERYYRSFEHSMRGGAFAAAHDAAGNQVEIIVKGNKSPERASYELYRELGGKLPEWLVKEAAEKGW